MNIIICTRDLDFGAGQQVITEIKEFGSNKKIKKILVIGPKKLNGFSKKVKFVILKNKGKLFVTKEPNFAFKCNKILKRVLKKEKFDEIYTHFPFYAEDYGVSLTSKFHNLHKSLIKNFPKNNIKLLFSYIFHFVYSYFDYRTIKYSSKVIFVSKKTMEEAKIFYPKYKSKFVHEPNSIDKSKFPKLNEKERRKLKKKLGFDDEKKNLLYVGRLDPLKGIMLLIKAIKEINNPNIRLITIGDGPLRKKIQKYSFVKYLGKLPNEQLYKYYNIADLFVLPSYYENYPLTVLEAKSCGCKILASDVGDNIYMLKKEELFQRGDKEELKIKLEKI